MNNTPSSDTKDGHPVEKIDSHSAKHKHKHKHHHHKKHHKKHRERSRDRDRRTSQDSKQEKPCSTEGGQRQHVKDHEGAAVYEHRSSSENRHSKTSCSGNAETQREPLGCDYEYTRTIDEPSASGNRSKSPHSQHKSRSKSRHSRHTKSKHSADCLDDAGLPRKKHKHRHDHHSHHSDLITDEKTERMKTVHSDKRHNRTHGDSSKTDDLSKSGHLASKDSDSRTCGKQSVTNTPSSSSEDEVSCEVEADYDFDWESHKSALNKIFFTDDDVIKRGSEEHREFWLFLQKYQVFNKKKALNKTKPKKSNNTTSKLDIPMKYDKRYRINVSVKNRYSQQFKSRHNEDGRSLTEKRVSEFRQILLHYLDFCQKQKFTKLAKIKKDQKNLPIYQFKDTIIDTVHQHQVVVVAGDTGCGKSTQVPQYLLEAGFTKIACTQPRRIACISLSKRVGYETLNEYGSEVAFQVRFEKSKTQNTRILFLTEGLLLRQISSDPALSQYSVIVIDEVHERHIHTDFLLGVLKCLVAQRSDLKIVLMSATININLFSNYFDDAPVVKVPGRLYPIQLQYCPISLEDKTERFNPGPYIRIMQKIDKKYPSTERGDLLIFLSGMTEIMTVAEAARMYAQQTKNWIVLPLHSALSVNDQDKVFDFAPEGVRKCIVSTNIAETSVTIDGVRFIIDSGKVKEMSFDSKCQMQRLQEFWISRASSEQRKGRAGRTGPGVCFRLYAESDYEEFQEYATPEIQRVPLDSLILQMISMGLPDARKFPFIEPPSMASIENAIGGLTDHGALATDESLTAIGQMLSQLPVDVVIGKMLIMGSIFHMIDPVLSIAAALSVQSPFTSRAHVDYDATNARKPLESDHGDPFTLLNAFDEWIQVKAEGRGTRKWCRRRGLEEQRFYEMSKLKQQFRELLKEHNLLVEEFEQQKYYTATERQKQHAERKQLSLLKRKQRNESRKRKTLKLEDEDFGLSDGEDKDDEKEPDIKDLEFRLSHDLSQLQEKSNESRSFTLRDVSLLKVILCSGLYPQVAITDEHNNFKADSEQAFHTKSKPFVLLHPTSVFITKPEFLQLQEHDVKFKGHNEITRPVSSKHQLLSYVSLLETTKPYLVNTMCVPALQTLTLYANSLDTNVDCTRVVCDGWLEIRFDEVESAELVITSVIQLRTTWQKLLQIRLQDTFQRGDEERPRNPRGQKLERILATKLTEFLQSNVMYSVRRILPAELQHLYRGPDKEFTRAQNVLSDIMKDSGEPHPTKGGICVNSFLTYNSLQDDATADVWGEYTTCMQRHWACPKCGVSMIVTVLERLRHEAECGNETKELSKEEEAVEEKQAQLNALRQPYTCPQCAQTFSFTTTETLKHRKTCGKGS